MSFYISLLAAYFLGGLTLIPLILLSLFMLQPKSLPSTLMPSDKLEEDYKDETMVHSHFYKVGYLQATQNTPIQSKKGRFFKPYAAYHPHQNQQQQQNQQLQQPQQNYQCQQQQQQQQQHFFAVLKFSTLFLYDSDLQQDCKVVINIRQYTVHIYPPGLKDHELFSKRNWIHLKSKSHDLTDYYFNCSRCVDKEDWYIALMRASQLDLPLPTLKNTMTTQFDQSAMNHLISTVHSDPEQFELQWLNALLGRLFLGIYKTERTQNFFYQKILTKVAKLNARRPSFLEEITVRSVDGGHGAPYITQPRLVHLSPQGEYTSEMNVLYDGGFRVELETVLKWTYSDRLPPIRIDLVLAITLKSIQGKMMVKIKEPPTNRVWYGFYQNPKIDWIIEPVVWEKRIGYSVVSKAIKSKIEEIFRETLVLPNMDDIVFFAADGAGGIFDAQKQADSNYESLPELYSTPSVSLAPSDPFLTTTGNDVPTMSKKRWFNRTNKEPFAVAVTTVDIPKPILSSHTADTPSQQTLRSLIAAKKPKKKVSSFRHNLMAQVDHNHFGQDTTDKKPSSLSCVDALHSVRLSKKMLMEKPSRLRSKSLPITGLSEINVVQDDSYNKKQQ
ncbi:hypothetical protein RMCBS344292_08378 [Rhizopus microsporus]|nr:hypothetical protein RMCBS344292_08378 [Rhizopus microsporus]